MLTKQDIIDISNKLSSTVISTNVDGHADTLVNVLQSLRDDDVIHDGKLANIDISLSNIVSVNDEQNGRLTNIDISLVNIIGELSLPLNYAQLTELIHHCHQYHKEYQRKLSALHCHPDPTWSHRDCCY